ncbi:MAG: GNAT family N-acetyltransferase [Pseudomonadota bacterium]
MSITITPANLDRPEFAALIDTHADLMLSLSPPGSCHFLPMDGLRTPDVTVWEMRDGEVLVGCGALKELSASHGELKSMHTLALRRGGGLGRKMLNHILAEARQRGYQRISLETGSMDGFKPSRTLYQSHGFEICPPFEDYVEDPNSVYMTLDLSA